MVHPEDAEIVADLLLLFVAEFAGGFELKDEAVAAAADDEVGVALADVVLFIGQLDDFLGLVWDFGQAQADRHGVFVDFFVEAGAEVAVDVVCEGGDDFGEGLCSWHGARLRLREGLVKPWQIATRRFHNFIFY